MELDELKKSWNALNEQLQKEPIADEQQITELIAGYKANTRKSLGRLVVIQRFSIGIGAVGLASPSAYMAAAAHLRLQRAAARQDCSLYWDSSPSAFSQACGGTGKHTAGTRTRVLMKWGLPKSVAV